MAGVEQTIKLECPFVKGGFGGGAREQKAPKGLIAPLEKIIKGIMGLIGPTAATAGAVAVLSQASANFKIMIDRLLRTILKILKPIGDILAMVIGQFFKILLPIANVITSVFKLIYKFLRGFTLRTAQEAIPTGSLYTATSMEEKLPEFKKLKETTELNNTSLSELQTTIKASIPAFDGLKKMIDDMLKLPLPDSLKTLLQSIKDWIDKLNTPQTMGKTNVGAGVSIDNKGNVTIGGGGMGGTKTTSGGTKTGSFTSSSFNTSSFQTPSFTGGGGNILDTIASVAKGFGNSMLGMFGLPKLFQSGGIVPETGLAYLHKGEEVIPAESVRGGTDINLNIDARGLERDIIRLIEIYMRDRLTSAGVR